MWLVYAILSAIFGSLMVVLMKVGLKDIDPNVGLFIRTIFVLVMSFVLVMTTSKIKEIKVFNTKTWVYLLIASVVTFLTWTFYFLALKNGSSNAVMAIDKCSVILTILINIIIFHEKLTFNLVFGILFFLAGSIFILIGN